MSDPEHARLMLAAAERDLRALAGMKDPKTFADEIFGFHAQQAAEKALKAWLSGLGAAYPRTHDLEELLALLEARGEKAPREFRALTELTDFAVQLRYESLVDLGGNLDRGGLIRALTALVAHVRTAIPGGSGAG